MTLKAKDAAINKPMATDIRYPKVQRTGHTGRTMTSKNMPKEEWKKLLERNPQKKRN